MPITACSTAVPLRRNASKLISSVTISHGRASKVGRLDLDDCKRHTFREMAKMYPIISPLRELRHALSTMRLFSDLTIGEDGQQSRPAQRVPLNNRAQSAEQRQVHFRHQHVDPRLHQAAARARHRLHRLVEPRGRHRRRACPATRT